MVKKQRIFWMDDEDWIRLRNKAQENHNGKGYLERYLEDIARNSVVILKKERIVKLEIIQ